MKRLGLAALLSLFVVVGCRVGPQYQPPLVPVPEAWKAETESCDCEDFEFDHWWEIFHDDHLNAFEEQAIANNPDLFVALTRMEEAWAVAGIRLADLYPQLNLQPSYLNRGILNKVFLPPGVQLPGLRRNTVFRIHEQQYVLPLNLSYELDLWGKYRQSYESAAFSAQEQEDAYYSALLSLTADVAATYFNIRSLDSTIDLLKAVIDVRRADYNYNYDRYKGGIASDIDTSAAMEQLASAEADYYDSIRERGIQENKLAVLLGGYASEFCLEHLPLDKQPPCVPAGVPSAVLLQRPDIAATERAMAAQHKKVAVAYADLFPSIELTGALGFLSPDFRHFLSWISRYWMIGANGNQTVFDGGRKFSNIEAEWARFFETSGSFTQQVLVAFREVEDALHSLEYQKKQLSSLENAVNAAEKTTHLSKERYRLGVANYAEVVEYQRLELSEELKYINLKGQVYLSTVQLIKALGGRWNANLCYCD